jgi:hypothetical protein
MCSSVSRPPPSARAVVGTQMEHTGQKNALSSESETGKWLEQRGHRCVAVARAATTGEGCEAPRFWVEKGAFLFAFPFRGRLLPLSPSLPDTTVEIALMPPLLHCDKACDTSA